MKSVEVRDKLADVLGLDLIGPEPGSPQEKEILPTPPSRWYLTGFLIPFEAPDSQRHDETASDQLDLVPPENRGGDDENAPEVASARRAPFPCSMGVSILVSAQSKQLRVRVTWGDYAAVKEGDAITSWQRTPRQEDVPLTLNSKDGTQPAVPVPNSDGLEIVVSIRKVRTSGRAGPSLVPAGTRAVSVFLVNRRAPSPDERPDESMAFQAAMRVHSDLPLVARPNLQGLESEDWDERVSDLQYRDDCEFVVGHGVSAHAFCQSDGSCGEVQTVWIPSSEVEKIEPSPAPGVELSMEALAALQTADEAVPKLKGLKDLYLEWIAKQQIPADPSRAEVAHQLLKRAQFAANRIGEGLAALKETKVFDAFVMTNKVMAAAARKRYPQSEPKWRPFQLAFLLLNIRGTADPTHSDRTLVDLLFFPTGGGKTEAYLGLAAFTILLRRLQNPGIESSGLTVLMRYTLRLLTLDQLGRAATLICAMELERQNDVERFGRWPFEIGLWVGQAATPNKMGSKGDRDPHSARSRTIAFQNDDRKPSPIPLENCPWCGTKFTRNSFSLKPSQDTPTDLRITCSNRRCEFIGDNPLPILAVDEPIYRRLPCFMIATVDKFASLPWVGPVGGLFGKVDRFDKNGFYGPCHPMLGSKLPAPLPPIDLVIQDELHLISGPLGTMVGLYETAIDELCTRKIGEHSIRPKIVASTATVRRAEAQIRALFARNGVEVFPCPGPDRRDSFFAKTVPDKDKARRYIGIGAQGRSPKVILLRTYLALLAAAHKVYVENGADANTANPADPYMTLVGYFNSLRELGGCRRIVEDEVTSRLLAYGGRMRVGEKQGSFANRKINFEVLELTSRESTSKVSESKRRLALPFADKERVDVGIATNMISVGLDIIRLGLMVVFGQPKTTAEYIQATSRVGRDEQRPGLVVTLMNVHKPRDRSHYERFEAYHSTFYRSVEATSVTPFSPRAIDRGIAAVAVGLARQGYAPLTGSRSAIGITQHRASLGFVADTLAARGERHAVLPQAEAEALRQKIRMRVDDLLDEWSSIADKKSKVGAGLKYQEYEEGADPHLLFDPLDPELAKQPPGARKFRAQRSLRDVEPSVNLWVRRLDGVAVPEEEAE
ncbi:MAG: DISARM system helicase DrmA [Bryobacteraceae bacterium]